MRIVFLGAPGLRQGHAVPAPGAALHGIPQISTGDLLRSAVARGTPLGLRGQGRHGCGQAGDDAIVLGMIRERLADPDAANGFILDGFPRNIAQADGLGQLMLTQLGKPLDRGGADGRALRRADAPHLRPPQLPGAAVACSTSTPCRWARRCAARVRRQAAPGAAAR